MGPAEFGITRSWVNGAPMLWSWIWRGGSADPELTGPTWVESGNAHRARRVRGTMRGGPLEHELAGQGARWTRSHNRACPIGSLPLDNGSGPNPAIRDQERGRAIVGQTWTLCCTWHMISGRLPGFDDRQFELSDGRWVVGFGCAADAAGPGARWTRTSLVMTSTVIHGSYRALAQPTSWSPRSVRCRAAPRRRAPGPEVGCTLVVGGWCAAAADRAVDPSVPEVRWHWFVTGAIADAGGAAGGGCGDAGGIRRGRAQRSPQRCSPELRGCASCSENGGFTAGK